MPIGSGKMNALLSAPFRSCALTGWSIAGLLSHSALLQNVFAQCRKFGVMASGCVRTLYLCLD